MLESFTWKDCGDCGGITAPAWGDSGSTGQKSGECALGNQQATMGASSSSKRLGDFGAEARELEEIRLADLHADVSHIQEVRGLVTEFVGKKGQGKRQTVFTPLPPRRPSQLTSRDTTSISQHELSAVRCASTAAAAATQSRQKDCSQAAIAVENVAASVGNTTMVSSPLVPRATDVSRAVGLGSRASLVAQVLVQVSLYTEGMDASLLPCLVQFCIIVQTQTPS